MPRRRWTWEAMLYGSNRPGHMFAAWLMSGTVVLIGAHSDNPWLVRCGLTIAAWEWLCTPDVDYAALRKPDSPFWWIICTFWLPYSWAVPHRSRFSHSLLYGLPCRFLYVVSLPLMLWWMGSVMLAGESPHINWAAFDPRRYTWLLAGAALADMIHLAKDGYSLAEMIEGKG